MSAYGEALTEVAEAWGADVAPEAYEDVCSVKRKTASGGSATLGTIHANVPCKIKALGGGTSGDAIRAKTTYEIEMPGSISGSTLNTVQTEDFLVVAARGIQPSRTYKVQSVAQDRGIKVFARCTIEA